MKGRISLLILVGACIFLGGTAAARAQQPSGATSTQPAQPEADQSIGAQPAEPLTATGSAFTYQGRLKNAGSPANGPHDFEFRLFDALTGGTQVGFTQIAVSQAVADGLFTVQLDFGGGVFEGDARWLEVSVKPTGGGAHTTLSPRQALTAAPYANGLRPGATIRGTSTFPNAMLSVENNGNGRAIIASSTGTGVFGTGSRGVWGEGSSSASASTGVYGTSGSSNGFGVMGVVSSTGSAVYGDNNGNGVGVWGDSAGYIGVYGTTTSNDGISGAVTGRNYAIAGTGVYGSGGAIGVTGVSDTGRGVYGRTNSDQAGVQGISAGANGRGVEGIATGASSSYGVYGQGGSVGAYGQGDLRGVEGYSFGGYGMYGRTNGGNSVAGVIGLALGTDGKGVVGEANIGSGAFGVWGKSTDGFGVYGTTGGGVAAGVYGASTAPSGNGVIGEANNGSLAYGVYGRSTFGYAGYFTGKVHVNGTISKNAGSFKIDHPLDPANKFLYHSFVESPDMKNIYDGVAVLDAKGEAWVELPVWFQALNKDFRYQLTSIGGYAPVFIAHKIENNSFEIAGGKAGMEVSWQVTGVRKDPYAEQHRIPVEEEKPDYLKGRYLNPVEHGQPESKGIDYERGQQVEEQAGGSK